MRQWNAAELLQQARFGGFETLDRRLIVRLVLVRPLARSTAPLFRWIAGQAMRRARPRLTRLGRGRVRGSRLMRLHRRSVSWFRAMCRRSRRVS